MVSSDQVEAESGSMAGWGRESIAVVDEEEEILCDLEAITLSPSRWRRLGRRCCSGGAAGWVWHVPDMLGTERFLEGIAVVVRVEGFNPMWRLE